MDDSNINILAEKLYNYGRLDQTLQPADAIIALGNMDLRLAEKAASLWHSSLAPIIVASGGIGRLTPKHWTGSEASKFAERINQQGVPLKKVIVEDKSTNIPENIKLSVIALEEAGLLTKRLLLVTLPFAERRIMALCQKQFPNIKIEVTSPDTTYDEFCNEDINKQEAINLIVGEIERLEKYPSKGFITPQEVPIEIIYTSHLLVEAGFDKYKVTD